MRRCCPEEDIALYVGNDLGATDRQRLEEHLPECPDCGRLVDELRQSQAILKNLRADMVPESALSEVRQHVMARVESTWMRRLERLLFAGLRWRYAVAGMVIMAIVAGSVWYRSYDAPSVIVEVTRDGLSLPALPPEAEPGLAQDMTPELAPEPVLPRGIPPSPAVPNRPDPVPSPSLLQADLDPPPSVDRPDPALPQLQADAPPLQVVMKLLTDDPNIVIYWLLEQNGGEQ